jgi:hypothetical protein
VRCNAKYCMQQINHRSNCPQPNIALQLRCWCPGFAPAPLNLALGLTTERRSMKLEHIHLLVPLGASLALFVLPERSFDASTLILLAVNTVFIGLPHLAYVWLLRASAVSLHHMNLSLACLDVMLILWVIQLMQSTSSGNAWLPYIAASMLLLAASLIVHIVVNRIKWNDSTS